MDSVFSKKEKCSGCSACSLICPKNAIAMQEDEEGFFYPGINQDLCINCGLCKKVCNFKPSNETVYNQKYYEVKSKNLDERMKSRSGGAFFCIANTIIENNGIVYGVSCSENCDVKFLRAETIDECKKLQGSKYVECHTNNIFQLVRDDLKNGKLVLFSGTACQIAGLTSYLNNISNIDCSNLLTIDIVCHGVPSQKIYKDYLAFLQKKYKSTITSFNFRDKEYGWNTHVESFIANNKKHTLDIYKGLFYSNYYLRPSCGNCPFASYNRPADITLADFVGIERVKNNFNDNKGISVVIINNEKGNKWFSKISNRIDQYELTKELCSQPNLHKASSIPLNRDVIWNYYKENGFEKLLFKYGRYDLAHRLKWKLIDYPKLKKVKNNFV